MIGYGYWGPNLVRNFAETAGARVGFVTDMRAERLSQVSARYPATKVSTDYRDLINDPSVDAVAIATPVSSHFDLAMEALRAGKHVLVEKPMTSTSQQAMALIDEAETRGLVLMVDHTFVYTNAVAKMRELTQAGDLGEIYYYDSVRINLGLFQHDVNVLWDLAVHDLSIMDFVLAQSPIAVSATGLAHVPGQPENIAYMTMFFDGRLIAHVHVNWLAPVKVRRTLLGGSRRMIVFDDLEASEKIKVYDRGISVNPQPGETSTRCWSAIAPATCGRRSSASPKRCRPKPGTSSTASSRNRRRAPTATPAFASCGCSKPRASRWRSRGASSRSRRPRRSPRT